MIRIELVSDSNGKFDVDELHDALLAVEQYSQETDIILRLISPEKVTDLEGTLSQFKDYCGHRIAELENHIH